jgi:hypothetical protein
MTHRLGPHDIVTQPFTDDLHIRGSHPFFTLASNLRNGTSRRKRHCRRCQRFASGTVWLPGGLYSSRSATIVRIPAAGGAIIIARTPAGGLPATAVSATADATASTTAEISRAKYCKIDRVLFGLPARLNLSTLVGRPLPCLRPPRGFEPVDKSNACQMRPRCPLCAWHADLSSLVAECHAVRLECGSIGIASIFSYDILLAHHGRTEIIISLFLLPPLQDIVGACWCALVVPSLGGL